METSRAPRATSITLKVTPEKQVKGKTKNVEWARISPVPKTSPVPKPSPVQKTNIEKSAYLDTSKHANKAVSPENAQDDATNDDDKGITSGINTKLFDEVRAVDVATKVSSKYTSKFFDYYSEALRKRLIRQLEESVKNAKEREELDFDSFSDSDDEPTHTVWGVPLKPDPKKEDDKKGKWKGAVRFQMRKKSTAADEEKARRRQAVLQRFRKKAHIIIFCIRCIKEHCLKFREKSELTPYITALNYLDYKQEQVQDLMFDRSQFTAAKKMRFPEEAKRILSIQRDNRTEQELYSEAKRILSIQRGNRTEQELYSAQIALRNIKGFGVLPARMQYMIAQCGQYESFESRRVITREGHPPAGFYFILSGTVVAMQFDEERSIAVAVDEFVRGDCFEENAMINDSPREVTILTKEPCEFMSISANDYKTIFMQGGVHNLNDPDQDKFLRSLKFLEGWPIDLLQQHPSECRFHYFKRGAVLSDDTHKTPWLIIVKSGSLSVLKKLKKVGPYEWKKHAGIKPLTEKQKRLRNHEKEQWRRIVLPDIGLPLRKGNEIDQLEERVDGKPKPFEHPNIKVQMDHSGATDKKIYYPNLWAIKHDIEKETDDKNTQKTFTSINKQFLYLMSSANDKNQGRDIKSATTKPKFRAIGDSEKGRPKTVHPRERDSTPSESPAPSDPSDVTLETMSECSSDLSSPRTTTSEFEEKLKQIRLSREHLTDVDVNPQFVTIQTMVKGDVWGLADLILEDQPSFMVVSNGSDCVLLNKNFYRNHCSEKLGRRLEQDLCPYPSDDRLQENLQTSVDWDDYRRRLLSSTMDDIRMRRRMRDVVFEPKPQASF